MVWVLLLLRRGPCLPVALLGVVVSVSLLSMAVADSPPLWRVRSPAASLSSTATAEKSNVAVPRDERATSCWPGFSPEENGRMSTCCWYSAATCCKSSVAGHILPVVTQILEQAHKNGTRDSCYLALADLICLWCNPQTASFAQGNRYVSLTICPRMCAKLWDSCKDQQKYFGIDPPALTWRQLCTALLVEEEEEDSPEGGVQVSIASEDGNDCFGGVTSLALVQNSGCVPHVTSQQTSSYSAPSAGAIAAMVLVPLTTITLTSAAVVAYFRARKRRETAYYQSGDRFTMSSDAFGEEGGFLEEEGDLSEGSGGRSLLDEDEEGEWREEEQH